MAANIFRSAVIWSRQMLQKSRSMHKETLSSKNKVLLHTSNRQDKNNIFERIFCIKGTWEENKKVFPILLNGMGSWKSSALQI